ncbi:uncharacterized protein LOC133031926 [Cannabis sativa]|uniref:uncharacterized protein LOC133031926 n=1 Tax=Cannabis sativa TaxID=3483 RepID=UPI0029C9C319|nr:uncharacterized protein LOC133031926 [Cannabis sativa]
MPKTILTTELPCIPRAITTNTAAKSKVTIKSPLSVIGQIKNWLTKFDPDVFKHYSQLGRLLRYCWQSNDILIVSGDCCIFMLKTMEMHIAGKCNESTTMLLNDDNIDTFRKAYAVQLYVGSADP